MIILSCVKRLSATQGSGHEKAESGRVEWVYMVLARDEYDSEEEYG